MDSMELLLYYLEVQLLWVPVSLIAFGYGRWAHQQWGWMTATSLLKLLYLMGFLTLLMPLAVNLLPGEPFLSSSAHLWMDDQGATKLNLGSAATGVPIASADSWVQAIPLANLSLIFLLFLASLAALALWPMIGGFRKLHGLYERALTVREIGRVSVRVTDEIDVPVSFKLPGRAVVLLPVALLEDADQYHIVVRHELQHHRQGDTALAWPLFVLRGLSIWNPFFLLWHKTLSDTQEYACDESLVGRKMVAPQAYGRCLIKVAEHARATPALPSGTMGMASRGSATILQRRIDMMFQTRPRRKSVTALLATTALALLSLSALAAGDLVLDRRIGMDEVRVLAENTASHSVFPVVANDAVLDQLNRLVGHPKGRKFMRSALERMALHQPTIETKLKAYNLPAELMAVPILESGYQSLAPNSRFPHAAGMWQFIPDTARKFNLRVDEEVDERLDVVRSTDAALRMLSALELQFQDWGLTMLAYNAGSQKVLSGIEATGTRDPWALIEQGYEGDRHYLSRLTAILIIMNHPELLD
ncbi:M56 and MltD domain-containing protein [Sulfidibacter corallicola]|uniref:Transglycosylase SLT domain-containing protein n=1 Tax=Sulfidibacter corallicola TaxID=2818388 RepID=A0A8A4TFL9_SULCO|nr:M56 and MltD domain-containing protein [Sulfidibacter corallicola]QTD48350.1 transglycosylase SLT domain-containing protein [Sulfidibacter corallicola]